MELVDPNQAKECAATLFGDPILKMAVNAVMDNVPKVEAVEVVHGRWCTGIAPNWQMPMCSVCQKQVTHKYDYCPNCGAKMDGCCSEGGTRYA